MPDISAAPLQIMEWHEVAMASRVGLSRQVNALAKGKAESSGRDRSPGWNHHIEGACGECAVAKYLNLFWSGSIDTYKLGGDIGPSLQVRTRSCCWYDHKIRMDPGSGDRDTDVFILATGRAPVYHLVGWCLASAIRAYVRSHMKAGVHHWIKDYGDRKSPAIFVPHSALREMSELREIVKSPNWAAGLISEGMAPLPAGTSTYPVTCMATIGKCACDQIHDRLSRNGSILDNKRTRPATNQAAGDGVITTPQNQGESDS